MVRSATRYRGAPRRTSARSGRWPSPRPAELYDRALWTKTAAVTNAAGASTALVGSPETVAAAILDYVDRGASLVSIRGYDTLADAVDYGRYVLPLVRAGARPPPGDRAARLAAGRAPGQLRPALQPVRGGGRGDARMTGQVPGAAIPDTAADQVEFVSLTGYNQGSELNGAARGGGFDLPFYRRYVAALEEAGFDYTLNGYGSSTADSFIVSAATGQLTERLKPIVALRPNHTFPLVAAQKLATIDQLTQGRAVVHLISGGFDAEQRKHGDYEPKARRYARTSEFIDLLRRAWTETQPFSFAGEFYKFDDFGPGFRTYSGEPVPISIGGQSDEAFEVGAAKADWFTFNAGESIEQVRTDIERVHGIAARAGRPDPRIWVTFRPIVAATDEQAWAKAFDYAARAGASAEAFRALFLGKSKVTAPQSAGAQRQQEYAAARESLRPGVVVGDHPRHRRGRRRIDRARGQLRDRRRGHPRPGRRRREHRVDPRLRHPQRCRRLRQEPAPAGPPGDRAPPGHRAARRPAGQRLRLRPRRLPRGPRRRRQRRGRRSRRRNRPRSPLDRSTRMTAASTDDTSTDDTSRRHHPGHRRYLPSSSSAPPTTPAAPSCSQPSVNVDLGAYRNWVRTLESAGFDYTLNGYSAGSADSFIVATATGQLTERLKPIVALRPNTVFPLVAAQSLATLDQLTEGRAVVHLISGGSDAEQARQGDYLPKDERYARTSEFIDLLRRAWTETRAVQLRGQVLPVR